LIAVLVGPLLSTWKHEQLYPPWCGVRVSPSALLRAVSGVRFFAVVDLGWHPERKQKEISLFARTSIVSCFEQIMFSPKLMIMLGVLVQLEQIALDAYRCGFRYRVPPGEREMSALDCAHA
jgi:hypothetical protein